MSQFKKYFTYPLTDATMTFSGADGYSSISMLCTSSTSGSFQGNGIKTSGNTSINSAALPLEQNKPVVLSDEFPADGITITAPLNCTIQIIAKG